jgi:hypothetical protein
LLARHDIEALAVLLGDKPCLFGDKPCAVDAPVFAYVASLSSPIFETPLVAAVERQANLIGYRDRILLRYFEG